MDRLSRYAFLVVALAALSAVPRVVHAADGDETEEREVLDADRPNKRPGIADIKTVADPAALHAKVPEMRELAERIGAGSSDPRLLSAYHRLWDELFPFDFVPPRDFRERALARVKQLQERAAQQVVPMATGCWYSLGPVNLPGRMTAVVASPIDSNIIYAGGADGGVWKTSNNGQSWTALTDTSASLAIGALALDPRDPNIIYAGLGEGNYSGDALSGPGVLKSTDGGGTWSAYPIAASYFHEMQVDPNDSRKIWGATRSGLYVSSDAGQTWNPAGGGIPIEDTTSVVASVKPGSSVILAVLGSGVANSSNSGLWRSTDGGASWARVTGTPASGETGRGAISQSRGNNNRIYVAFHTNLNDGILGVWRSDDEGALWTQVGQPNTTCGNPGQCWYNFHITTDATNPDLLYLGAVSAYKSADAGMTWTLISTGIHVDQHFLFSPEPGHMLIANDGGLYRTPDAGTSWQPTGEKLVTAQYYHVTSDPDEDTYAIGGAQDNGTQRYRGTPAFDQVIGADGAYTAIDWVDTNVWYGSTQNLGMLRSRDRGLSFVNIPPPRGSSIPTSETRGFIAPFALDRGNPSTIFAGATKLYRSIDQGDNFVAISPVLIGPPPPNSRYIRSIDNCRDAPDNIWVGTNDGKMWSTPDGGANWIDKTGSLPDRSYTSIAVHPSDPGTVYVTLGGTGTGHVYKTTDAGASWTDMSAGLPDITARHILIIPEQPQTLLVGFDLGIFRTDDGGQTWNVYGTQLPNVAVDWIGYTPTTGTVKLATHGRGLWQLIPLNTCPMAPSFAGLESITTTPVGPSCQPLLSWQPAQASCPSVALLRYNVYRSTDPLFLPGPTTLLAAGIPGTSYTDITANANVPYYYIVRAEDSQTGFPGPANGGREDLNTRVLFFELGNPFSTGTFTDPGGDGNAWLTSRYWSVDNTSNTTPAGQYAYHSAVRGSTYAPDLCAAIETPDMVIGAAATLRYQGSYNIEDAWDGVVVEVSTDGGNNWSDLPPSGGYPSTLAQTQGNGCGFPATRAVFNGPAGNAAPTAFQLYTHDLASLAGQTARFRWEITTDAGAEFEGFRLDDIVITPVTAPAGGGCNCAGTAPDVNANTLLAVRLQAGGNRFSWTSSSANGTWNLHTTAAKSLIPGLPADPTTIVAQSVPATRTDDPGTFPAGFYQAFGADCAGNSVP